MKGLFFHFTKVRLSLHLEDFPNLKTYAFFNYTIEIDKLLV